MQKKEIVIQKGEKLNATLKKAIETFGANNKIYIFDPLITRDYDFKEKLVFADIEQFVEYVNFSGKFPFSMQIKSKMPFKKIEVIFASDIENKLKDLKYETKGNINSLNEIKDLLSSCGVSLDIDFFSAGILNSQNPTAFKGNAYDFIKSLCSSNNLYFETQEEKVKINQYQEKVYDIGITPLSIQSQGTSDLKTKTTTSSGESKEGATGQATQVGFGYKIYDELKESVIAIIGKEGMYHLNQASGQLIVRARPQNMELINQVVKKFNEMYSIQLEIELEIMEVSLNEAHQNGVDFSLIGKDTAFSTAYKSLAASSNFATLSTDFTKRGTRVKNMVQMLNTFGSVEMTSKPTLKTLNSVPGVISIGLDKDYISDVKITPSTSTSAASYDISRDTATDGIKLYVYPRVTSDNTILLTIQPQTSSVLGLDEHSIGGLVTMQTKTVNNREFSNTMTVKDGETTLLAGFLTQYKNKSKYGMPWIGQNDSTIDYIGGMKNSEVSKTELVLAITARIIN